MLPILTCHVIVEPLADPTCEDQYGPGWVDYNGEACYRFLQFSSGVTWQEAEAACQSLDVSSHLASVHSGEEEAFIRDRIDDRLGVFYNDVHVYGCFFFSHNLPRNTGHWIGMEYIGGGQFGWVDQTEIDYVNFRRETLEEQTGMNKFGVP